MSGSQMVDRANRRSGAILKRAGTFGIAMSLLLLVAAAPASADSSGRESESFEATITEDFAFLGCPAPVSPRAFTCGTATADDFGRATVETFLTGWARLPSGCFADSHTSTLTFRDGGDSLVIDITGTLCGTGGRNFVLDGSFAISGGTGRFAGATGGGSLYGVRQNGPIVEDLAGRIILPDDH